MPLEACSGADHTCRHPGCTEEQSLFITELPEGVLASILHHLDPVSLSLAAQACVALLRAADAAWPPSGGQHYLLRAARACLGAATHLPCSALDVRLDYAQSARFPLSLPLHGLRHALAAPDVYDAAQAVASAVQAAITMHRRSWRDSQTGAGLAGHRPDPIALFSACRADRGCVRLALCAPAVVRASLDSLHGLVERCSPASLALELSECDEGFALDALEQQLAKATLHSGGDPSRPSSTSSPIRIHRLLQTDLQSVLAATSAAGLGASLQTGPCTTLPGGLGSLEAALSAAWAGNARVLQAAGPLDVQCLVRTEQAVWRCICGAGAPLRHYQPRISVVAAREVGQALAEHVEGTGGSALGSSLHLAPTSALARLAGLLRESEAAGAVAGAAEGASCGLPDPLAAVAVSHPEVAVQALVQLAGMRALRFCAAHMAH